MTTDLIQSCDGEIGDGTDTLPADVDAVMSFLPACGDTLILRRATARGDGSAIQCGALIRHQSFDTGHTVVITMATTTANAAPPITDEEICGVDCNRASNRACWVDPAAYDHARHHQVRPGAALCRPRIRCDTDCRTSAAGTVRPTAAGDVQSI